MKWGMVLLKVVISLLSDSYHTAEEIQDNKSLGIHTVLHQTEHVQVDIEQYSC